MDRPWTTTAWALADYAPDAVLGVVLAVVLPFLGLYLFAQVSRFYRLRQRDVVGPHVVEPIRREYGQSVQYHYRCKYCGMERERKAFFRDEDCEGFEADE
ncbi:MULTISPECIES: hypothetical protein [Halorussus]|uniref:hypothetical protein n=1 Tax=Halorussus TaxID=1070314 RepID=UPI00209FFF0C|nr:hypothetical protein [Halorussus vallis]USZ75112.1 hypothetical protein NGM07_16965 [Halorussus vallis]